MDPEGKRLAIIGITATIVAGILGITVTIIVSKEARDFLIRLAKSIWKDKVLILALLPLLSLIPLLRIWREKRRVEGLKNDLEKDLEKIKLRLEALENDRITLLKNQQAIVAKYVNGFQWCEIKEGYFPFLGILGEETREFLRTFHITSHLIPYEQYMLFTVLSGYRPEYRFEKGTCQEEESGNFPVVNVSYTDAEAYCNWLDELIGGKFRYRLPDELQWEKAVRERKIGSDVYYEWTRSGVEEQEGAMDYFFARGGSSPKRFHTLTVAPNHRSDDIGFRIVREMKE